MIAGIGLLGDLTANRLGGMTGGATPGVSPGAATATSFASALEAAATRTVSTLEQAESASMGALQGGLQTREVIDAVMSAEQSLQAAISIRDKIVTAYLEISRMAI